MFDVTQVKVTEASLRERDARVRALAELVPAVIYTSEPGPTGRWLYVSPQVSSLLGFTAEEWLADRGRWLAQLHPDDRDWVIDTERATAADRRVGDVQGGPEPRRTIEYRLLSRTGEVTWVRDDATIVLDAAGVPAFRSGVLLDITRQRQLEEELVHRATHDPLTGLANRTLFQDRVEHAFGRVRDQDGAAAVLFLDLDDFKRINDAHGHAAGDAVLQEVAKRIRATIRPGDTAARLGGDEFGVLLEDVPQAAVAMDVAERLCAAISVPFALGASSAGLLVSVGVAWQPVRDVSPTDLVRDADMAMYVAKRRGSGRPVLYTPSLLGPERAGRGRAVEPPPAAPASIRPRRRAG